MKSSISNWQGNRRQGAIAFDAMIKSAVLQKDFGDLIDSIRLILMNISKKLELIPKIYNMNMPSCSKIFGSL